MQSTKQDAVDRARSDLAQRLGASESEIAEQSIGDQDFPDAALGAPREDEMSAQVITPGWRILFTARGQAYEYRANARQLRLVNFNGKNYRI